MMRVRGSIPIWVAMYCIGGRPRATSFIGRYTPSVGKFGKKAYGLSHGFVEYDVMVVSCRSLNTPRCVACYLDFRKCSTDSLLGDGLSLHMARAFASF